MILRRILEEVFYFVELLDGFGGACHVGEAHEDYPGFPAGVYVSDVNPPYDIFEVKLEALQAEASSCDKTVEPYRCGLLSALFDFGDTTQGKLRGKE